MQKRRFAIIGGGWRSEFYVRVARALPERFELASVWMRNPDKAAAYGARHGVKATASLEEALSEDVDFRVVAISPWPAQFEFARLLVERGLPMLLETPPGPDLESLNGFWDLCMAKRARVMVAEEYHFQPYHASVIELVRRGVIGEPTHVSISMMHGYHCANLARQMLRVGPDEAFEVRARAYRRRMARSFDKAQGELAEHPLIPVEQVCATVDFESGKTLFYDFCDEQYFSQLRTPYLRLCGERGEIFNNQVRFISEAGACMEERLRREDLGAYANLRPLGHRGFSFLGGWAYENPFCGAPLTDDEIAVAANLDRMGAFLETGAAPYSLADACQDTYIHFALGEAARTGRPFVSEPQHWNGARKGR